ELERGDESARPELHSVHFERGARSRRSTHQSAQLPCGAVEPPAFHRGRIPGEGERFDEEEPARLRLAVPQPAALSARVLVHLRLHPRLVTGHRQLPRLSGDRCILLPVHRKVDDGRHRGYQVRSLDDQRLPIPARGSADLCRRAEFPRLHSDCRRHDSPHSGHHPSGGSHLESRSRQDRKSTRLNSSHVSISYAVFCLLLTGALRSFPTRRSSDLGGTGAIRSGASMIKGFQFPRAALPISVVVRNFLDFIPTVVVMILLIAVITPPEVVTWRVVLV